MKTTLNNIRKHSPCSPGWAKLLKSLNKTTADDEPLEMSTILNSNGLDDTLWCLRSIEGIEKECRLFAVFCAHQVQHLNDDPRVKNAIDVAERFAFGEATVEELAVARAAAHYAIDVAERFANGNATVEELAAARAAAHYAASAAHYATYDAAYDVVYAAARSAAYAVASAVVREEQKQKFIEMFC